MPRKIAGIRAVTSALNQKQLEIAAVYLARNHPDIEKLANQRRIPVEHRPDHELDCLVPEIRHQGAVAIAGPYPYADISQLLEEAPSRVVVLDGITDPYNFGAIVRSSVAFGVKHIVIQQRRACPVTPVVVRASTGATEYACIARVSNISRTLAHLSKSGYETLGLAAEGNGDLSLLETTNRPKALVIGSEGTGLRRLVAAHCEQLVRIPLEGPMESLNASVAAGVALYVATRSM
ncbi:MAG: 23S rRNA (guanosine(2251)-2'-O)-methyltransferase RlmB [Myxococcota bacterium]